MSILEEGAFTFSLDAYEDEGHTQMLSGSVKLDVTIYFKAEVETQSNAPNLDLYPVRCYSSQSDDADDTGANFTLISNGWEFLWEKFARHTLLIYNYDNNDNNNQY